MPGNHVFHVDMSGKFHEKEAIGVAWVSIQDPALHRGTAIGTRLLKDLKKNLCAEEDWSLLYAICIYWILKDDFDKVSKLIVCNDYPFTEVLAHLNFLFKDHPEYDGGKVTSLHDYRIEMGNRRIGSAAHNVANSYRKRGRQPNKLHHGTPLAPAEINYSVIESLWTQTYLRV